MIQFLPGGFDKLTFTDELISFVLHLFESSVVVVVFVGDVILAADSLSEEKKRK